MENNVYYRQIIQRDITENVQKELKKLVPRQQQIPITCGLSGVQVQIPVRHQDIKNLKCLFDLKSFVSMLNEESKGLSNFGGQLKCSECKSQLTLDRFGIDRALWNCLGLKKALQMTSDNGYDEENIYYDPETDKYAAAQKTQTPAQPQQNISNNGVMKRKTNTTANQAPNQKISGKPIQLPGQRKQFASSDFNYILQNKIKVFAEMVEDQSLTFVDAATRFKCQDGEIVAKLEVFISETWNKIDKVLKNNIKINEMSLDRINQSFQFCFGLQKIYVSKEDKKPYQSALMVYYPVLSLWKTYNLMIGKNKYIHNEFSTCLKSYHRKDYNFVVMIGGYPFGNNGTGSNQMLIAKFKKPQNDNLNEEDLQLERLIDFPFQCSNLNAFLWYNEEDQDDWRIYIYGGVQIKDQNQLSLCEQIIMYKYKDNKLLQIPTQALPIRKPRYDGQVFFNQENKFAYVFGGFLPSKDMNTQDFQQAPCEFIEIFDHNKQENPKQPAPSKSFIPVNYGICNLVSPKNNHIIQCKPLFTHLGQNKLLLISGKSLGNKGGNKTSGNIQHFMYTLDLSNGTLEANTDFSKNLEEIRDKNTEKYSEHYKSLQFIHDYQGVVYAGRFFTVIQKNTGTNNQLVAESKSFVLSVNQINGQSNTFISNQTIKWIQSNKHRIPGLYEALVFCRPSKSKGQAMEEEKKEVHSEKNIGNQYETPTPQPMQRFHSSGPGVQQQYQAQQQMQSSLTASQFQRLKDPKREIKFL